MYIIKDLQFEDRYFGGYRPIEFKSLREAVEQLILYHEMDCDMEIERKLFEQGKIEKAQIAIENFEWKIIKI